MSRFNRWKEVKTPEQIEADKERRRERAREAYRRKMEAMTPEQLAERRARLRENARKRREAMTPEQREELRANRRPYKSTSALTPEQLEARRQKARERYPLIRAEKLAKVKAMRAAGLWKK